MKKLLIADDEEVLHSFYREVFSADYEIFQAFDGAEALMLAVGHHPDVMILDVMMPILDGRTVCRKLKGNAQTADIRIGMFAGNDEQYDRRVGFVGGLK